ncbi:MAG: glycosyltransferase [Planctomycetes bacterium]|nr:glycosyltransferase [Planctomycetota bacterium]
MISLCMIVRNEESNLPRVLGSVLGLADESVVVDTGSTDRSVEVAKSLGARVEFFEWIDDFSAARNHALSMARGDWIMVLDADDEFEREDIAPARRLLGSTSAHCLTGEQTLLFSDKAPFSKRQILFVRNGLGYRYVFRVHEMVAVKADLMQHTPLRLRHFGYMREYLPAKWGRDRRLLEMMKGDPRPLDRAAAAFYLGRLFENERRREEARAQYADAAHSEVKCPFRVYAALGLARLSAEMGDSSSARSVYEAVLECNPRTLEAELGLADLCLGQDLDGEALRHFRAALATDRRIVPCANDLWERQARRRLWRLAGSEGSP